MLSAEYLDLAEAALRKATGKATKAAGGIQVCGLMLRPYDHEIRS